MSALIRVTATLDGRRRAGFSWSRAPIELAAEHFSAEQLAALEADPFLIVEHLDDPPRIPPPQPPPSATGKVTEKPPATESGGRKRRGKP